MGFGTYDGTHRIERSHRAAMDMLDTRSVGCVLRILALLAWLPNLGCYDNPTGPSLSELTGDTNGGSLHAELLRALERTGGGTSPADVARVSGTAAIVRPPQPRPVSTSIPHVRAPASWDSIAFAQAAENTVTIITAASNSAEASVHTTGAEQSVCEGVTCPEHARTSVDALTDCQAGVGGTTESSPMCVAPTWSRMVLRSVIPCQRRHTTAPLLDRAPTPFVHLGTGLQQWIFGLSPLTTIQAKDYSATFQRRGALVRTFSPLMCFADVR